MEVSNIPPAGESLDDLTTVAESLDQAPPPGGPPGSSVAVIDPPPPPPTNAKLLQGALTAGRDVFCGFTKLQSPKTTLADDTIEQLAHAWGPVLDKHGINLTAYLGDYGLEIAALVVTVQIGLTVRAGVLDEIAQRDAKNKPGAALATAPEAA